MMKVSIILTAILSFVCCNIAHADNDLVPFTVKGITEAIKASDDFCNFDPKTFVYLPYDIDGDGQNEMLIKAAEASAGVYVLNFQNGKANVIAQRETPQSEYFTIYPNGYLEHTIEAPYEGYAGGGTEYFKLVKSKAVSIAEEKANPQGDGINVISLTGWKKFPTDMFSDAKGYCYQIMGGNNVGVVAGGNYSGAVVIPSQVTNEGKTYKVTTIRRGAMWNKDGNGGITSITLPESVTLVGADAFRGNAALTSVKYGKNTRIEVRSFWGCPKLTLQKNEPVYGYTEPFFFDEDEDPDVKKFYPSFTRMYYPTEQADNKVIGYNWAFFKSNHCGIAFDSWKNLDNENAMACYCSCLKNVKSGLFRMMNAGNVESMFKGYLMSDNIVVLADNSYVATHEFPAFSRWIWGEKEKSMSQTFVSSMEKKYARKAKYSYECGHIINSSNEQLAITEFNITNNEAMVVFSWVKDGKEVCSYVIKKKLEAGQDEENSVWNVDDDGTYGIPTILTIARDERGNIELFLDHTAPESTNMTHLVQQGNKFVEAGETQWYNWFDSPE